VRRGLAPLILLGLLCAEPAPAAAIIDGHLKSFNLAYEKPPGTLLDDGFFSGNSQRLALKQQATDSLSFEFAIDNLLLYSDPPGQITLPVDSPNRRIDLEHDWNRGEDWSDRLAVDRLTLRGSYTDFDWSLGRQAIGFGRIVIFSPLDIVAPFAPDTIDTDIRPGVDALRAVHYFGLGGQVGGTVVFGPETTENSYLMTLSDNRAGIDLLGIGGILRDREMAGFGLAGSLGTLGIKVEASYYRGKDIGRPGGDLHDTFTIGALELWYRFDNSVVLLTEYLYNGAGAHDSTGYFAAAGAATYREGLSFLLGRNYLLAGPSWDLHPLVTVSGLVICNLDDDSTLLRPQLQVSLQDNLGLDLFYAFNSGREPEVVFPGLVIPRSEFGSAGDSGGLLLRWYF